MNERIKLLAVEARQYAFAKVELTQDPTEWSSKYYNEMFDQKFAELIVRECAEFARQHNLEKADRSHMIHKAIEEHFGVEE